MRQLIISLMGFTLIAFSVIVSRNLAATEKPAQEKPKAPIPVAFTSVVKNGDSPITVSTNGRLTAQNRIELFSEVQGIFEYSSNLFKPGIKYNKGSVLLRINSDEHRANLRAQKSNLYNQIVATLPDLRFDFANAYNKWEQYITNFDANAPLQELPKTDTEKEQLFIAGKGINSTWFSVKNLEERLSKYTIYAPFAGVLTQAAVNKGALIRSGQKIGEFIDPSVYELEVAVNASYSDILKVGNTVALHNIDKTQTWNGKIVRINSLINPNTQTIQAFIQVRGKDLREGLYLEADLAAKSEVNTIEIPRDLLTTDNKVFIVQDTLLKTMTVTPVHYKEQTVIIRGLTDGTQLLQKTIPGAYEGMRVKIAQ